MTRPAFAIVLLLGASCLGYAHPMGNFSVSHYARFDVSPQRVNLTYVLDLAELPTFDLLQMWNLDGRDRDAIVQRAIAQAPAWLSALHVKLDGAAVAPRFQRAAAQVLDGAGGLPVLRVEMSAALPATGGAIEYEDLNYAARTGWKEIVIVPGPGVRLDGASHGVADRSHALRVYPADATAAPPQDTRTSFRWTRAPGATVASTPAARQTAAAAPSRAPATPPQPAAAPPPPSFSEQQQARSMGNVVRGDYLSRMLGGREIPLGVLLVGISVAFGLGALHALSPGHGKTIVAAYLVGSRGTIKHAAFLGGIVTFTHTASVFALGIGVLLFQQYVVPEKVIPVLGAVSGISIVAVGAMLLYQRAKAISGGGGHHHHHDHDHHDHGQSLSHSHPHPHPHTHEHGGKPHSHAPAGPITLASLVALGVSGGLVPCPSALVLLLSSIALGRAALGLLLLTAFSGGLAVVLMAIGGMVIYAKNLLPDRGPKALPAFRYIPVFSAAVVIVIGLVMTGVSLGWIPAARLLS